MRTQLMSRHARTLSEHVKSRRFDDVFKVLEECRTDSNLSKEFGEVVSTFIECLSSSEALRQAFMKIDSAQRDIFLVPVINDLLKREYPVELVSFLTGLLSMRTGQVYSRLCEGRLRQAINHQIDHEVEVAN